MLSAFVADVERALADLPIEPHRADRRNSPVDAATARRRKAAVRARQCVSIVAGYSCKTFSEIRLVVRTSARNPVCAAKSSFSRPRNRPIQFLRPQPMLRQRQRRERFTASPASVGWKAWRSSAAITMLQPRGCFAVSFRVVLKLGRESAQNIVCTDDLARRRCGACLAVKVSTGCATRADRLWPAPWATNI